MNNIAATSTGCIYVCIHHSYTDVNASMLLSDKYGHCHYANTTNLLI